MVAINWAAVIGPRPLMLAMIARWRARAASALTGAWAWPQLVYERL